MSQSSSSSSPAARIAIAAIATLVTLVGSHVAFVALYSHLMDPGHDAAYYQDFAQRTGAPFATLLGIFVVFLVTRWLIESADGSPLGLALTLIVAIMVLNAFLLLAMGAFDQFVKPPHLLGEAGKLLGALLAVALAGRGETRRASAVAA